MSGLFDYDRVVWAKSEPFCALSCHMIAVGACAQAYLSAPSSSAIRRGLSEWLSLSESDAVDGVAYAFALHDIGKAHPSFQYRRAGAFEALRAMGIGDLQSAGDVSFRHEFYGSKVLLDLWRDEPERFPGDAGSLLAAVVGLHHQGKRHTGSSFPVNANWQAIQRDLERRMRRLFCPCVPASSVHNADALGILLTALLVLCDWVASSDAFGALSVEDDEVFLEWALERAGSTLRRFGLVSDAQTAFPMASDFCDFWPAISRRSMRPLQRACEEAADRSAALTIIEAPPGEGKTEAALYLAGQICRKRGLHGIYMALPTAATSNQMVDRVRRLLADHGVAPARLLHGTAWMVDGVSMSSDNLSLDEDAGDAAAWLRPLRRGLLSENAVGTVDQAMASVLWIKYGMLRLAGLAEKVLVIDEIHAYDVYMSTIIERLLAWCRALRIPVILLSATLQQAQKKKYIRCFAESAENDLHSAYPLITQVNDAGRVSYSLVDGAYVHTRFHFQAVGRLGDVVGIADMAQEMTRNGGCLCVMLNTVGRAQAVYRELKRRKEKDVMLFHARFRMARRAEIERACLTAFGRGEERPDRMILVCTQVVEQSLDVDFDGMITELAPVDLLLQRIGRVHRHAEVVRPAAFARREVVVLTPPEGAPADLYERYGPFGSIYAPCVLHATEQWLGAGRVVRMPEDVRETIEGVYLAFDEREIDAYARKLAADACAEIEAEGSLYPPPSEDKFFGRMRSKSQRFNMEDEEELGELLRRKGARTRNGQDSVCVAFLPSGYHGPTGGALEQARDVMRYACSLPLTGGQVGAIMGRREKTKDTLIKNRYLRHCVLLLPEADGSYLLGGERYFADDEIGVWREDRQR